MKILTLSIKQKYFDEILAGTKKVETREIRHTNFDKYCRYAYEGKQYKSAEFEKIPSDATPSVVPVKYDALKLLTGAYANTRPYMLIKVKKAEINLLIDEEGNDLTYEVDGETYLASEIDYHLGEIIEKHGV